MKWVLGGIVFYSFWTILSSIFFCIPVRGFWDSSIHSNCLPKKPFWLLSACLNIATDLTIFLLPMPVLTTLTLPWRQKVGVVFIFGVGLLYVKPFTILTLPPIVTTTSPFEFHCLGLANRCNKWKHSVCIISVIRLTRILQLLDHLDEFSQLNSPTAAWSSIESNLAILCSCMPALRPVYSQLTSQSTLRLLFCREKKSGNASDSSYFVTSSTEPHNLSAINPDNLGLGHPTRDRRETV